MNDSKKALRQTRCKRRGVASVEFLLGTILLLLPLMTAILELAQLTVARYALNHAVAQAARLASTGEDDLLVIRKEMAVALLPLMLRDTKISALPSAEVVTLLAHTARPDKLWIELEEWLPEGSATDTAADTAADTTERATRGIQRQRLKVKYCRELFFPPIKQILPSLLQFSSLNIFDAACLARESMPLRVWAPVLRPSRVMREFEDLPTGAVEPTTPPIPADEPPISDAPDGGLPSLEQPAADVPVAEPLQQ